MTDDPTTNADLVAKLDALAETATGRPWFNGSWSGQCHLPHYPHGKNAANPCKYDYTTHENPRYISSVAIENCELVTCDDWGPILSKGDAQFIVALVNAWPRLREIIVSQQATLEECRAELLAARECCEAGELLRDSILERRDGLDIYTNFATKFEAWRAARRS